jgi:multidrug efflux pump subunit AcrA (membrane-fusion protein)
MKKSLIAFIHSPSKVIALSLVIALGIGLYGYLRINEKEVYTFATAQSGVISDSGSATTRTVSLGFLAGGRIKSVDVVTGAQVKKGQELAALDAGNTLGALTQAKAAYAQAQASYDKVVNGATGPTIDVARAAVNTAQVNLSQTTDQQKTAVANAKRALLNSTLTAESTAENMPQAPIISGTYTGTDEGIITINAYPTDNGGYFSLSGLVTSTGKVSMTDPQAMGDTGLFILFPEKLPTNETWTISIPNTKAPNYIANYNAYQQALQTQTQTLATLQATLDQATASLTALVTAARPEDVAQAQAQVEQAQGALQIAQAAYGNTIITAPYDGTITSVSISVGQIAQPNASAIELQVEGAPVDVAVMIPQSAVIPRNGSTLVLKKSGDDVVEQKVTLGAHDAVNVEVLTGLVAGDEVVTH